MKKIRDIVAVTGTYKDSEGNDKNRYSNCGSLLKAEDGRLAIAWDGVPDSAILHAATQGKDTLWLSLFEIRDKGQQQPAQQVQQPSQGEDIPF
tara:strand:- start:907 stop:1185 length:279 start_codon:yes stop_codon:yes gene_type:complete